MRQTFGLAPIMYRSEGPGRNFRGPAIAKGQLFLDSSTGEYYRALASGLDVEWQRIFLATSPIGEVDPQAIVDAVNAYLVENPVEPIDLSDGLWIEGEDYTGHYDDEEITVSEYVYPEGPEGPKVEVGYFNMTTSGVQFVTDQNDDIGNTYERLRIRQGYIRFSYGQNELTIERPDELLDETNEQHLIKFPLESGILATREWVTNAGGGMIEGVLEFGEEPPNAGIWLRRTVA